MPTFRVFLGAPSAAQIRSEKLRRQQARNGATKDLTTSPTSTNQHTPGVQSNQAGQFHWQTLEAPSLSVASSGNEPTRRHRSSVNQDEPVPLDQEESAEDITSPKWLLPPSTLDAVSRRLSSVWKSQGIELSVDDGDSGFQSVGWGAESYYPDEVDEESKSYDQSGMITWPPTIASQHQHPSIQPVAQDQNKSLVHDTTTHSRINHDTTSLSHFYTQDTTNASYSLDYSDTSSITRFPSFHIRINTLNTLRALQLRVRVEHDVKKSKGVVIDVGIGRTGAVNGSKVNILCAVLEIEGPDTITIRKGPESGKQVSVLRLVLGEPPETETSGSASARVDMGNANVYKSDYVPPDGEETLERLPVVSKLTAWREIADRWGGKMDDEGVSRGDIVYIRNISYTPSAASSLNSSSSSLSLAFLASPSLSSALQICYRTLPTSHTDRHLRPDLRLGASDAGVRRVKGLVEWVLRGLGS